MILGGCVETKPKKRKKVKVVSDETLLKCVEVLRGDDKKKANKVRRSLSSIPQERLASLGVTPEELESMPDSITRTLVFGVMGKLYSGDNRESMGDGSLNALPHERLMRATDEYYNNLIRKTRSLFVAYNQVLDGPEQKKVRDIQELISAEYDAIRVINQQARKKVDDEKVTAHLETIKKLKVTRAPLFVTANKERNNKVKNNKAATEQLKLDLNAAMCECRAVRPEGIWHGAYLSAEAAFETSRKKCIEIGALPRLRNEWKGEADNFLNNTRWNGEGVISASHSIVGSGAKAHELQKWSSILMGKNKYLKVRKFAPSDLAAHGLKASFCIRDDMYLVSIARGGKVGDPHISAAVILHRQPTPDTRITISRFIVKKVGLRHVTSLQLVCNMESHVTKARGVAYVCPCWEKGEGYVVAAHYTSPAGSGTLKVPLSIASSVDFAGSLDKVVSKELSVYNTLRKTLGLEPKKRGDLRWMGRPDALKPKDGVETKSALSLVASDWREREDEEGPHGVAGGGAENEIRTVYANLKRFFTFTDEFEGLNFTTAWMFRQKFQHLYPWA